MIEFTAYGIAVPMARPRAYRTRAGGVRTFNPSKCTDWKDSVRLQALEHRPAQPLDGPLRLAVTFYLPRPKSLPKRVLHPAAKPDFDNLVKAITDSLEGVIYTNDSRIVDARIVKAYSDTPRVEVRIEEIETCEG